MTFSQDEINLMCIYDTSDKTELLKELRFSVPYIEDTELKEITETVIDKLERMMNFLSWSLNLILIWRISLWQMKKILESRTVLLRITN